MSKDSLFMPPLPGENLVLESPTRTLPKQKCNTTMMHSTDMSDSSIYNSSPDVLDFAAFLFQ